MNKEEGCFGSSGLGVSYTWVVFFVVGEFKKREIKSRELVELVIVVMIGILLSSESANSTPFLR